MAQPFASSWQGILHPVARKVDTDILSSTANCCQAPSTFHTSQLCLHLQKNQATCIRLPRSLRLVAWEVDTHTHTLHFQNVEGGLKNLSNEPKIKSKPVAVSEIRAACGEGMGTSGLPYPHRTATRCVPKRNLVELPQPFTKFWTRFIVSGSVSWLLCLLLLHCCLSWNYLTPNIRNFGKFIFSSPNFGLHGLEPCNNKTASVFFF